VDSEFRFLDDDDQFPFFPEESKDGLRVVRYGLISAPDPVTALRHPSVPKRGDALIEGVWLFAVSKRIVQTFGGRVGTAEGPQYKVEVTYQAPTWGAAGVLRPAAAGDTWTEVTFGTTNLTVYAEVGVEVPPGETVAPLNGGDGMTRDVGTMEAVVRTWFDEEGFREYYHPRLVQMSQGYVNAAPVVLPRLMGSTLNWNMGPEQVRYVSVEYAREGDFYGIHHHLKLAPTHKVIELIKDANGMIVGGGYNLRQIYEPIEFGGLW